MQNVTASGKSRGVQLILVGLVVVGMAGFVYWESRGRPGCRPTIPGLTSEEAARMAAYRRLAAGKTLAGDGRHEEALAIFDEIAEQWKGTAYGWDAEVQGAHSQGHLGRYDAAIARFDRIITDCPYREQIPAALIARADVISLAGRHGEAVELLEELVATGGGGSSRVCADALFKLARIHERLGEPARVRAALERIAEDHPGGEDSFRFIAEQAIERLGQEYLAHQEPILARMKAGGGFSVIEALERGETSWTADGGPYLVTAMLSVEAGDALRMGPGTVIRFAADGGLQVKGLLEVSGTAEASVQLVPLSDDPARDSWRGVELAGNAEAGCVRLAHCRIVGAEVGLAVSGGRVRMERVTVANSGRSGLLAEGAATIDMTDCSVVDGERVGVECQRGVELTMTDCTIARCKSHGLLLRNTGRSAVLSRTTVERCGGDGIRIRGDSAAVIEQSRVTDNRCNGVRGFAGGSASLSDTTVGDNGWVGVHLEERWDGEIRGCRIIGNQAGGIVLEVRCSGRITDSIIERNGFAGLRLRLACTTTIAGNRIAGNDGVGIRLQGDSRPARLQQNQLVNNTQAALANEGAAAVDATRNWWGSSDADDVAAAIQDQRVNAAWGKVIFEPFLTVAPATLPDNRTQ